MLKLTSILLFLCTAISCVAQSRKAVHRTGTSSAIHVMRVETITEEGSTERDSTSIIYALTPRGDSLFVYARGKTDAPRATVFSLSGSAPRLVFRISEFHKENPETDSLLLSFDDVAKTVTINENDVFKLYPEYYKSLKDNLPGRNAIPMLFAFLEDEIGPYPLFDVYPILITNSSMFKSKSIAQATIRSKRSQSDLTDVWTCTYQYAKKGYLTSAITKNGEEVRSKRTIEYPSENTITINSFSNVEDRQVRERRATYKFGTVTEGSWSEEVVQTGLNKTSKIETKLTSRSIKGLPGANLSREQADVYLKKYSNTKS